MKHLFSFVPVVLLGLSITSCASVEPAGQPEATNYYAVEVIETSKAGNQFSTVSNFTTTSDESGVTITVKPWNTYQEIVGIGGSFTEASAFVLNQLEASARGEVLEAYFGTNGAAYSLTRTHIGACDFSVNGKYTYDDSNNDVTLQYFSVAEDEPDLIPLIHDAQTISSNEVAPVEGNIFKIVASPWTCPIWMKTITTQWYGAYLNASHYQTFANYTSKYITEYNNRGISIWAITPINEPGGNGGNFESLLFGYDGELGYVKDYLGPTMNNDHPDVKILAYDHNRDGMKRWADELIGKAGNYVDGIAVHWYSSTTNTYNATFDYVHSTYKNALILQTEGCIDAWNKSLEGDFFQNDDWWWGTNATDWGWDWGDKKIHPKYVAVYRYAKDIIETINHYNNGWIDWNIVLDRDGGPNHVSNWCGAPVLVDTNTQDVYYTPIYYMMKQFSRTIRPGAKRIYSSFDASTGLYITAVQNPANSLMQGAIAVQILNVTGDVKSYKISVSHTTASYQIGANTLQTLVFKATNL